MNIPNIRFKGFVESWEQRKLGEVSEKVIGGGTPKTSEKSFWNGNIPWFQSADLIEHNVYLASAKKWITEDGLKKSAAKLIPSGSIAIVTRVGVGKLAFITFPYATSQDFLSLSELNIDGEFGCYAIYKLLQREKNLTQGTSIKGLTKDELLNKKIDVPCYEEQQCIGSYFSRLDNLITLHQNRCDKTKTLKKYMLQKMFPKKGESFPEIRFEGFTEPWEQRKFENFVKKVAKKNKNNLELEPYAVTNDKGFIAQKEAHDDFGYMNNVDRTVYNIVPPNSFAYNPARINVGSLGYYEGTENVIVSSLYEVFQTEEYIDDKFLLHWFKSDVFPRWIEKLQEGSVRLYFYFDKLVQCKMMVPSLEEQNRISAYLDNLDNLITLHQRKCDELKEVKRFMLSNMFPKKG